METFEKLMSALVMPVATLNVFGGIISGIWLAILGEWGLIGYGILALLVAGMGIGLALAPGLNYSAPSAAMFEKGNKVGGNLFGMLGQIYTVGILTAWCILVLVYYTEHADADSLIPILIWSYGVATGPIVWLAQKDLESGNEHGIITTFFTEVAYILTILAILFAGVSLLNVFMLFGVVMSFGLIVQLCVVYLVENSRAYY